MLSREKESLHSADTTGGGIPLLVMTKKKAKKRVSLWNSLHAILPWAVKSLFLVSCLKIRRTTSDHHI